MNIVKKTTSRILILFIFLEFLSGCSKMIKIPEGHAAIVFNKTSGELSDKVLLAGNHSIGSSSEVFVYKISEQKIDINVDYLYSNADFGEITFDLIFDLNPNYLVDYSINFGIDSYPPQSPFSLVITSTIKSIIRETLQTYSHEQVNEHNIENIIKRAIELNNPLGKLLNIRNLDIKEFKE